MEEKNWFAALTNKRLNTVETLKEAGLNTFINHIIGTYHEPAHFIYELLQNADDAKASKARLELKKDGILFTHNGKINFTITNPEYEREQDAAPGHINAITAFSLSGKRDKPVSSIGKFGIGFKSIFQYTNTPHIYNPPYCFKIEQFIVPHEIKLQDGLLWDKETTAFWLPFDKREKPLPQAYTEISARLKEIKNPLLFLKNLDTLDIINSIIFTRFIKEIEEIEPIVPSPYIKISKVKLNNDTIIKFSQKVKIIDQSAKTCFQSVNVGFVLNEAGHITADEEYKHYFKHAWCYLPTMHETRLNYILNAPFLLSPNRETIKESRTENKQLIAALNQLASIAIDCLDQLGYITESINNTLPVLKNVTADFMPIAKTIITKIKAVKERQGM
ncbi:sacsin N-terminal ATP-binding-like domain-containing protein [Mucilaginibacter polytrichastri]|nr:hypothetical protein [Mucilaginibacter polytrichastri]SFT27600.1 hypothetical protein SAMN04487890_1317 [Mucilaginibacter polytrichastri]